MASRYELRQISAGPATYLARLYLGDRHLKQHLMIGRCRQESAIQRRAGLVRSLVDKLEAHPVPGRQIGDCR